MSTQQISTLNCFCACSNCFHFAKGDGGIINAIHITFTYDQWWQSFETSSKSNLKWHMAHISIGAIQLCSIWKLDLTVAVFSTTNDLTNMTKKHCSTTKTFGVFWSPWNFSTEISRLQPMVLVFVNKAFFCIPSSMPEMFLFWGAGHDEQPMIGFLILGCLNHLNEIISPGSSPKIVEPHTITHPYLRLSIAWCVNAAKAIERCSASCHTQIRLAVVSLWGDGHGAVDSAYKGSRFKWGWSFELTWMLMKSI